MSYQGDLKEDQELYFTFTTRALATGIPITFGGTPAVSVYIDNSTTQSVAGVTLIVDLDGVTGFHAVKIDTSVDAFYTVGADFTVVVTTGTVDGNSVVGEVLATFSIENRMDEVDVTAISGDTTAADNLELQYDTNGLTGDNFPATQQQIGALAVGAGGISTIYDSFTLTTGGTETNDETATTSLDGLYHIVPPTGGVLDMYYEFDVGFFGIATTVTWDGYVQSQNDNVEIYAWNWITSNWDQIGTIAGANGTTEQDLTFSLTNATTGTSTNSGKVRVRFASSGGDVVVVVATDRILVEYAAIPGAGEILNSGVAQAGATNSITLASGASSVDDYYIHAKVITTSGTGARQERIITDYDGTSKAATTSPEWTVNPDNTSGYEIIGGIVHTETQKDGYTNGGVWVDTVNGVGGTQLFVNGTEENPVNSWADAQTIQDALDLRVANVLAGSTVTLDQAYDDKQIEGRNYVLVLNGQSINNSSFRGASSVTGVATSAGDNPNFFSCGIGDVTLPSCNGFQCGFFGTFTVSASGGVYTWGGSAGVFGAGLTIDFGAGNNASTFALQSWGGGTVVVQNAGAGTGTYGFTMNGLGDLVVEASCLDDFNVDLHGHIDLTNNSAVTTIDQCANYLDTNIKEQADAAISDVFTFTKAGEVDSNVTSVNEIEVTGDGSTGNEWGPV